MFKKSAFLPILLLSPSVVQAQPTQLRGTVTDSMCGKHHMMKNASAAECTRTCVKSGADFALVSGDKRYILKGDKSQLNKLAESEVVVSGDLNGTSLTVKQIKLAR